MKSWMVIFLIACILAACSTVSTGTVENQSGDPANVNKADQPTEAMVVTTGTGETGAYTEYKQGDLSIQLFSPKDGEVFNTPEIQVSGRAPAETVISINDQIILVTKTGEFSVPVSLEEGPNVIELVASDMDGNELNIILTVMYEP